MEYFFGRFTLITMTGNEARRCTMTGHSTNFSPWGTSRSELDHYFAPERITGAFDGLT
jgi:hypothetical protein